MATSDRDRALREAFRFDGSDLAANRAGRISPRQDALLGAGRRGMLLSLAVFAAVMVGSVGLVAFFDRQLQTPGGQGGIAVAAGSLWSSSSPATSRAGATCRPPAPGS